ncbi:MAG: hypothetical protein AB1755_03970 [Candidatus Omnitrophota bacterium]
MKFHDLYGKLEQNKYYLFSFKDTLAFFPKENKINLKKMISRWKEKGWLTALKKECYELSYPRDFNIPDFYIANRLYAPSYVSLETALSNYSIISEVAMSVTSVTTKSTRKFKNKHGLFTYRTVKPEAFCGYYVEKQGNFDIFIAEPEKALVDYLYFKTYRNKKFNFEEERLDRDIISNLKKKKLDKYAQIYKLNLKELIYANL